MTVHAFLPCCRRCDQLRGLHPEPCARRDDSCSSNGGDPRDGLPARITHQTQQLLLVALHHSSVLRHLLALMLPCCASGSNGLRGRNRHRGNMIISNCTRWVPKCRMVHEITSAHRNPTVPANTQHATEQIKTSIKTKRQCIPLGKEKGGKGRPCSAVPTI